MISIKPVAIEYELRVHDYLIVLSVDELKDLKREIDKIIVNRINGVI